MKELLKKVVTFTTVALLTAVVTISNTYASDEITTKDSSGNLFCAGQMVSVNSETSGEVENELFAAGMEIYADNLNVNGSIFTAGQNVSCQGTKVGGSIFAAGNNVSIDAEANNNIWVAGNSISFGKDSVVKGLHAAGNNIIVNGKYDAVAIAGSLVTFNAEVAGDVSIEAEKVVFGENAKIGGNLVITSKEDPGASDYVEGTYEFKQLVKEDNAAEGNTDSGVVKSVGKAAGKAAFFAVLLKKIKKAVLGLFKYAILAVVLAVLFKKNLADSYEFSTKRPASFWGFGALALLFFPIVAIVLCITVIGAPLAGLAGAIYVLAICMSTVFAFASLAKELIFTHTSKRLHPIAECVIAVLPAAIIRVIPVVGGIVGFACAIYTMGYVCLAIADTISANIGSKKNAATEETGE